MQRHERIDSVGCAGFLRADGTEVSKSALEVFDAPSIYKVVLINTRACAGVDYLPCLANFEDVAFIRGAFIRGSGNGTAP